MSDTATVNPAPTGTVTGGDGADAVAKPKTTHNVNYQLEIVDDLPERAQRTSPLEDSLDKIIAIYNETPEKLRDAQGNAKWVVIGRYQQSTAAGAAANVLGQRHGKSVNVEGWEFATRRIDEGDTTGLFVKYTPEAVVPGAKEEWVAKEKERKQKLEQKRAAKKAAEASTGTGAGAGAPSAPDNSGPGPAASNTPAATPASTPAATASPAATPAPTGNVVGTPGAVPTTPATATPADAGPAKAGGKTGGAPSPTPAQPNAR